MMKVCGHGFLFDAYQQNHLHQSRPAARVRNVGAMGSLGEVTVAIAGNADGDSYRACRPKRAAAGMIIPRPRGLAGKITRDWQNGSEGYNL